ncbi:serine/Arginine-related protein 53 isoform X2 [Rhineura floridana]|nr:serine/Arginine-related protein 53 isoform X2 [Rhineura floridana]XP_061493145.1 serine/Arginine-related protein 53 isoform X2 [Rhineura floridana]XP_061493146.1 serine/Arginine-related protein 53 isoform X2 [Rhineura floridana]XP_061493147.1 serine/Arginine-related protein 53 isoform X2 [Rhineura floridana]XP_061493148.1 serine/Arginine-related protein 53 isoform X2 [Rhineura floridana]
MGRRSSDTEEENRSRRKKKHHRRSSSSSSSDSRTYSRKKSGRKSRSRSRDLQFRSHSYEKRHRHRSSSSSSYGSKRKRSRSRSRGRGKLYRPQRSRSKSRTRRSHSRPQQRSYSRSSERTSHRRTRSRSRDKERRKGRDKEKTRDKERARGKEKDQHYAKSGDAGNIKTGLEHLSAAEQAKARLQLVLEAAAKADEALKAKERSEEAAKKKKEAYAGYSFYRPRMDGSLSGPRPLLPEIRLPPSSFLWNRTPDVSRASAALPLLTTMLHRDQTSLVEQVKRVKEIEAIENDSFVPQTFRSSKEVKKAIELAEVKNEPATAEVGNAVLTTTEKETVTGIIPTTIKYQDENSLAHPNLFVDKAEAEERWFQRLIALRQERLMGSPVAWVN